MTDPVQAQYEAYPYPARHPRDEARRLITGSPSHLDEINHYLFAGRRDFSRPFRALVAGGGTGDATIMLAQQLAERGGAGEVVYLDLSAAARGIAEARAGVRGLTNLQFVTGDLTALETLDLGRFDYIDCCGVLHHLEDPQAGLRTLRQRLAPGGGLGIMVYGRYGRTGLYPLQAVLRRLAGEDPLTEQVELARRLLQGLPASNWFKRNPVLGDHKRGDAELVDLLLHRRDRAYDLPALFALTDAAGLAVTSFIEPIRYRPEAFVKDPSLRRRLDPLRWRERAAIAEVLAGNLKKHVAYLAPAEDGPEGPESPRVARPGSASALPLLPNHEGPALARACQQSRSLKVQLDGLDSTLPLPRLAPAILMQIDGRRTLGEIHAALRAADQALDWPGFLADFQALFTALNGINALLLKETSGEGAHA